MEQKDRPSLFQALQQVDCETGALHGILADARRRYMLRILAIADSPLTLRDIARELIRWQDEGDGDHTHDMETVHLLLYHIHVPKLEDAGLIEYDQEQQRVRLSSEVPREELQRNSCTHLS